MASEGHDNQGLKILSDKDLITSPGKLLIAQDILTQDESNLDW